MQGRLALSTTVATHQVKNTLGVWVTSHTSLGGLMQIKVLKRTKEMELTVLKKNKRDRIKSLEKNKRDGIKGPEKEQKI